MPALPRIPPLALVALLAALMAGLDAVMPRRVDFPGRLLIALLLALAGIALAALSITTFRRARTTLDPRDPSRASALVTHGVFALSRNPIYAAFLLWLLAWCLVLGNPFALAGALVFLAWMNSVQIPAEERALAARFGEAFENYRARVRRWI